MTQAPVPIDPADDPLVNNRLHALPKSSYPVNYAYLGLLKDRMEQDGLYQDDMIPLPLPQPPTKPPAP